MPVRCDEVFLQWPGVSWLREYEKKSSTVSYKLLGRLEDVDMTHSCSYVAFVIPLNLVPNIYRVRKVCSTSPMIGIRIRQLDHAVACVTSVHFD